MAGSLRIWTMTFVIVLLAIVSLPLSLFSATPFLNVFPDSPRIPGVTYSGESSYTQVYTPSGSQWAPGLDEREVFFASLKHSEDSDSSWEIRIGKGGQLYSIRGPFGESQAPQAQPDAHWVDQIFQLVGVDRTRNKTTPGHAYFIHQAGVYLDDPLLKTTFYSPILASEFDAIEHKVSVLAWGQQAHIPNVHQAGLLYYEQLKDLGGGIIEITYVIYNFGTNTIDYLNTPWGGVRKSALPVTIMSRPDGSFQTVSALWGDMKWVNLDATRGWIAWTRNSSDPQSPTLALVAGKDNRPRPRYQSAPARFRYGTGAAQDDFEAFEFDPFAQLQSGTGMFFRVYLVIGSLSRVESLADTLTGWAQWGPLNFDDKTAFVPLYSKSLNGQTILDLDPEAAAGPIFYTFAQPLTNSSPLFVLRDTNSHKLRLTTDPCELCIIVRLGGRDSAYKPYAGNVEFVAFLGYVVPKRYVRGNAGAYLKIRDILKDPFYFPAKKKNNNLRAFATKPLSGKP